MSAATESLFHALRRSFVWNRYADGLRAFGLDFGPFAVVVLRNGRNPAVVLGEVYIRPLNVTDFRLALQSRKRRFAQTIPDVIGDLVESLVGVVVGRSGQFDHQVKGRGVTRKGLFGHALTIQCVVSYVKGITGSRV